MTEGADIDLLVARAQEGDVRAFEQLVAAHLGAIRRFARAFAPREADADDLAQEALIKVYRSLRLFRHEAAFSTWLYTVVRSVFLDAAKSRAWRERLREDPSTPDGGLEEATSPAADELMSREEDRRRVWQALRRLPAEFRTALVLFDIEGCSYGEVASIDGVPVGTVKSRLSRGRAQLKELLEEDAAAGGPEPVPHPPGEGPGATRAGTTATGASSKTSRGSR